MRKEGQICHTEIPAPDLEKARTFYGNVFGWSFEPMGPHYWLFSDGVAGGALDQELKPTTDGVRLYFQVTDIEAALALVRQHGGEVVTGRTEIGGGHGYFAHFRDPNGNVFGIHAE